MSINITHGIGPDSASSVSKNFEEVDVPAIQAEIQERKLEDLPSENLFSRDVAGQQVSDGFVDATSSETHTVSPQNHQSQVVETTPGLPSSIRR
ncbi:MAG: hypothetical protein EOO38_12130 [Cytophagaceae bacterium]|nr:MAG: hypothetical protein EOO38_12130 [Cytophagaceae bacterium]